MNLLSYILTLIESPSKVRYLTDQVQSLREENRRLRERLTVLQHTKDDSFCSCCISAPCGCDTEE
jgi:cell shape-determining protein MreC